MGDNSIIGENVKINGPVIIGKNCRLENCEIGSHTAIGDNNILSNVKINNSLLFDDCQIDYNNMTIENSIIGKGVSLVKKEDTLVHKLFLGDNTIIKL